jgi:hypothetical protein
MWVKDLADFILRNWQQMTVEMKPIFPRGKQFEMHLT